MNILACPVAAARWRDRVLRAVDGLERGGWQDELDLSGEAGEAA
jgi:hypothetical protein